VNHIIGVKQDAALAQVQSVTVDENGAGQRLDNFLMRHLKGVPKTHVYRIIRSGEVRINKGRAQADTRLNPGDVLRLPPVRVSERAADKASAMAHLVSSQADAKDFPLLFEDDSFLVIDKPAGVAVHGGSGVSFGVIEQLRMARPQSTFLELVHRLDRETSGVLLVAKKRSALKNLQDQFRERETGKTYLALVLGAWPANKRVLDQPLHKYLLPDKAGTAGAGERRVKVVAKDDPDGLPSLTLVKVRAASPSTDARAYSLLEVTLKTGRTHQIRVHLASEGMPIAGDDKYGDFDCNKVLARSEASVALKRMFLHAWQFQCRHPVSGKRLAFQAPLPAELARFLHAVLPDATQPNTAPANPT
jgi:23S rRNA pseudouridine955/2504/2580 synthase